MFNIIRKIILTIGLIYTVPILFIVFMKLDSDSPIFYRFIIGYLVILLLALVVSIITFFLNIRKAKWNTIKKIFLKFIISSFVIWALSLLFFYLTKGEFQVTKNIDKCITIGFIFSFGDMLWENKEIN